MTADPQNESALYQLVQQLCEGKTGMGAPVTLSQALCACEYVSSTQAENTEEAFRVLVCLNLLNAYVKTDEGKRLVSYEFIKGHVARLFRLIDSHPRTFSELAIYWDSADNIAYFRAKGIQLSFHYPIFSRSYRQTLALRGHAVQQWDGLRLQAIASELFTAACPDLAAREAAPPASLPSTYLSAPTPVRQAARQPEHKALAHDITYPRIAADSIGWSYGHQTLDRAIHFNPWHCDHFTLYMPANHKLIHIGRYVSGQAEALNDFLRQDRSFVRPRKPNTFVQGRHYYVSPRLRIRVVAPSRYHRLVAQHHYLVENGLRKDLCITYGIALYLAERYPQVRFLYIGNTNRECVRTIFYQLRQLQTVPPLSERRRIKGWLVVDPQHQLRHFNSSALPHDLVMDYLAAPDAPSDYSVETDGECFGIKGFGRLHLLPCQYRHIRLRGNFAYVEQSDGKKAIYALRQEVFRTDFIYDHFRYDAAHFTQYGETDGTESVIFRLRP